MKITCDPGKWASTFKERGLDFYDAATVFMGRTLTLEDDRFDYGETRYQSYGLLGERVVMIVWTPRGDARHIISMRHCHDKEARKVRQHLG